MFWIATAAAIAANSPAIETSARPGRQAQAAVRVIEAARVQLGEGSVGGDQRVSVRETTIRDPEGQPQPAVSVEFSGRIRLLGRPR